MAAYLTTRSSFTNAAFAYGGTEVIVLAGAEAKNPSRQIPKNVRLFVYRQLFFCEWA